MDNILFEAATADFFSKNNHIQADCYGSFLFDRRIGLDIIKFYISNSEKMIEDARNNQAPFCSPITLCRDITSYNLTASWVQERIKYIKVLIIKSHFPQLTMALCNCTSPPVIVDLVGDADPTSHPVVGAAWGKDKQPPVNMTVHGADQAWVFPPALSLITAPLLQRLRSPKGLPR